MPCNAFSVLRAGDAVAEPGTFAALLRALRTDAGLTQEELAEAAQVSVRAISDLERGVNPTARKDTARLLADALRLSGEARAEFEAVARGRAVAAGAETAGPSGLSGAAGPVRTLPRDISSFTGREAELAALVAAATAGGTVSIHAIGGMAGVGKTAFAVHAAHRLADSFPDGQFFLPLHGHTPGQRPADPADALASLLLTAGLTAAQIPSGVEARAALWRDRLADKRAILILDDATSSEQVRPLLPAGAQTLVIVTSRRHLVALNDAAAISLDTLPPGEAAELFIRLAARSGLTARDPGVSDITRLCGYLPLAVGILARQLHHHPSWPPAELADELVLARDRLELMAAENLSVAAAFTMSYARLTGAQQRMFRLLGLHPGVDTDHYAAAALAGLDPRSARECLDALYSHYLIAEPTRGRYRMHDLIRAHAETLAAEQDPPAERDAAAGRLLGFYVRAASEAAELLAERPPRPRDRLPADDAVYVPGLSSAEQAAAWFDAERANILDCVAFAAAGHHPAHAVRLVRAASERLISGGHWSAAHRAHEHALAAAKLSADPADLAWCLVRLAESHKMLDEYDDAAVAVAEAVRLYRGLDDRPGLADALTELGEARSHVDHQSTESIAALTEAIGIYREIADPWGEVRALGYLGGIQVGRSEYPAALRTLDRGLELSRELGDRRGQARSLNYLSAVYYLTGDFAAASASVTQAIPLYRELGSKFGEAHALMNLGGIQITTGDGAGAIGTLHGALDIYRELGDRLGLGNALSYLGEAHTLIGQYATAADLLDQALPLFVDIASPYGEGNVYRVRGEIARRTGDHASAAPLLDRALAVYREHGIRLGEADTLTPLGDVQRQAGDFAAAAVTLDQALGIYREIGDRRGQSDALNQLGALALDTGDVERARQLHAEALSLAREVASPADEAGALAGLRATEIKAPLVNGTEVGPMSVFPDKPARLREDAALPLLDVHGTEPHRAGGVEEPAVTRFQDGEAGPPQRRVEAEGSRTG
jgi:tetratricopeptide (TPR) repeat protein/transcriptional regulator with XRE-family HTH domain